MQALFPIAPIATIVTIASIVSIVSIASIALYTTKHKKSPDFKRNRNFSS